MNRQAEKSKKTGPEVANRVRELAEAWRQEGSEQYDQETFAEFRKALDKNRLSSRKLLLEDPE